MYTYMSYMVTDFFFLHISPQFDLESLFLSFSLFFFFFLPWGKAEVNFVSCTYIPHKKKARQKE